jgi:hypothetical protein
MSMPPIISGYKIVCNTEYIIPDETVLDFNERFFYLLYNMNRSFFDNMNPMGDNIYLYDANGSLLDMVGWNSQHEIDGTVCRVQDGNGARDGYDDASSAAAGWQFDCTPTIQLVKIDINYTIHTEPTEYGHFESNVIFNLIIYNFQQIGDVINILSSSQEGWFMEIFDETGTIEIENITVNADGSVNIIVNVTLPDSFPCALNASISIVIRSSNSGIISDSIVLNVKLYPFLNLTKNASPSQIYLNGTGHDEITTITLNMIGMGIPKPQEYLDCVFCIDSSGSMAGNDPRDLRKVESQKFVSEHFEVLDRGAVVDFDSDAWLVPDGWPIGDHLSSDYEKIKDNIALIDSSGGTTVSAGLNMSNEELRIYGQPEHDVPIIILITDAQTDDDDLCIQEAIIAASRGVRIFTIGLMTSGTSFEQLLIEIAEITGGAYFEAPDASHFKYIYEEISGILENIAVWDDDLADPHPLARDVLPWYIDYVPGTFSIQPDNIYNDSVTGETILEWNIPYIEIGEVWIVSFDIKSNLPGLQETNVYDKSRAFYTRWDDTTATVLFPKCWINVLSPAPLPPKLYIDILPNKDDILLYWDEPLSTGTDHYLIYRATDPRGFDFSTSWVNTSSDIDPADPSGVQWPGRLTWNHTGAADPFDSEYEEQWYYCIRAVNVLGETSCTSRTVGKWTKEFTLGGVSTFSLPLEPLEIMNTTADFYLADMNADYIKWMDPTTHVWNKHGDGCVNDTQLEVGKGYEVRFSSATKYTFMGMPGAMIRYNTGSFLGFDYNSDAKSLSAAVDPVSGDVILTWSEPGDPNTVQCCIYYSTTRDGFHGTRSVDYNLLAIIPVAPSMMAIHAGAALSGMQYYYMVIPLNITDAEGATTYSIGVWTSDYQSGYDTLGIPLILGSYPTADWYCDQMDDVVGINYFLNPGQRWSWHSEKMPEGAFDPVLMMTEGYQISTSNITKFTFIGV